ncbi:peptidoglycan recognition protein family protein [Kocuria sp. HSID16901]|uniref:peptidoglycan recognition protein family protein n=1 Tax=Kocuria sp. HSID16901 TaxID=2419505 RepID=UPI00066182E2|nr:peptidoglycan recognition family protein [Kocuria sp. HSID16901]RUQ23523.1 N-acetylmuramoyl-L-alanine amidase [Kocuria sp. HSID16901]
MSYTLDETTYNSPNFTPAAQVPVVFGGPRVIEGVTVHWWGDPANNPSFEATANELCKPGTGKSAHFVLEAGRVACLVSPENVAWHAGSAQGNRTTIGIECNPRMTDKDLETLVEVIGWLESAYGSLKVYPHQHWSPTACPGDYMHKIDWVIEQVNAHKENNNAARAALREELSLTSKEYDDIIRELRIIRKDTEITRGGIFGTFSYTGEPGTQERGVVQLLKAIDRNTWNTKKMVRVLFDQFKVGIPGVLGDGDFGPLLRKVYGRWVRNAKGKDEWVTGYPEAEVGKARKDWWDKITKNTYDF